MTQSRTTLLSGAAQCGQHRSPAFAEADRHEAVAACAGARITSSPSSRKRRSSPEASAIGLLAALRGLQQAAVARPRSGPEIVPVPSRSPGRRLQPLQVWCAIICATVQYMCRVALKESRCGGRPFSRSPASAAALRARDRARPRAGRPRPAGRAAAPDRPPAAAAAAMRNGASASGVIDPGRDRRRRSSWPGTARAAGIPRPGCRAPTSRSAGRSRRYARPPRRSGWARPARCRDRSRSPSSSS